MLTLACRGCCCGTAKHLDVDHDAHLRALAATGTTLEVTPCLGPCRWSNVIVAIDPRTRHQHWFAKVLTDADLRSVTTWLTNPSTPPPDHLLRRPPRPDRERAHQIARAVAAGLTLRS